MTFRVHRLCVTALATVALLASVSASTAHAAADAGEDEGVAQARATLEAMLGEKDLALRGEAHSALGLSRIPGARERLEAALEGEDGRSRFGAARGLVLLANPASAPAVVKAFREEQGWAIRKELALAAAAVRATELIPELQVATMDGNKELATAAAFALTDLGSPEGQKALARLGNPARKNANKKGVDRWSRKVMSGTKDGDLRLATRTLAELGTKEDVPLFRKHLTAPDARVRLWAAAGLLRHIGAPSP